MKITLIFHPPSRFPCFQSVYIGLDNKEAEIPIKEVIYNGQTKENG
jgi:hypothetical protein